MPKKHTKHLCALRNMTLPVLNARPWCYPHLMPKAKYYKNAIGYIPCDRENESVAKVLEYAYDDWCISIFAEAMSDFETKSQIRTFFAKAYEFYFDKSTRFMRGLDSKGEWRTPFNPRASTHRSDDYCEGTAWQWTWFVPHDVDGLVNLMGGEDAFVQKTRLTVYGRFITRRRNDFVRHQRPYRTICARQ